MSNNNIFQKIVFWHPSTICISFLQSNLMTYYNYCTKRHSKEEPFCTPVEQGYPYNIGTVV